MKVSIQIPAVTPLNTFFDYLKIRAADPVHENNVDLIADFVDKVLVHELKRLANEQETITQNLDIPDSALLPLFEPWQKVKADFDNKWNSLLNGKGYVPSVTTHVPQQIPQTSGSTMAGLDPEVSKYLGMPDPCPATPAPVKKSGNGHKSAKVRELEDSEKDLIRSVFTSLNGQITEDACKPILSKMDPVISIFQVTGFVSYLHRKVAEGVVILRDLSAYLEFLKQHRGLWATYNSPKYEALRARLVLV